MSRKRGRPILGKTGCLFWLFILLVIVVVLVYRGKGTLKETIYSLGDRIRKEEVQQEPGETRTPVFVEKEEETPELTLAPEGTPNRSGEKTREREPGTESTPGASPGAGEARQERTALRDEQKGTRIEDSVSAQPRLKDLTATIYFVKIEREKDTAHPYPIRTTVQYVDSPITRTMNALLKGPSSSQQAQGVVSFIPQGTALLGAQLKNGHLTLNFSSRFESNYSGREAILLQLSQVMLTAFEFGQVSSVSILIEGQKKQYITGEGIPLLPSYTKEDLIRITSG